MANPNPEVSFASIEVMRPPRVVAHTAASELGAMSLMLSTIPDVTHRVDAVATFPGLGERGRIGSAVRAWERPESVARRLLIAGITVGQAREETPSLAYLERSYGLRRSSGVRFQPTANNTPNQANWLMDQVEENDIRSVSLHVTPFHLIRAIRTVLPVMERRGIQIPVIPVAARVAPGAQVPEADNDAWDMFSGETDRMERYQAQGDVAPFGQVREYVDWLWQQPILADQQD